MPQTNNVQVDCKSFQKFNGRGKKIRGGKGRPQRMTFLMGDLFSLPRVCYLKFKALQFVTVSFPLGSTYP